MRRDPEKQRAWQQRSAPLRRTAWNPTRKRIRQRSAKQVVKDREFNNARRIVLERDGYTCQLSVRMDGHHCTGHLHVHHIRLRSQGGTHDLDNLVTLCGGPGSAHEWVHAHPAEARLFGLIEYTEADQ